MTLANKDSNNSHLKGGNCTQQQGGDGGSGSPLLDWARQQGERAAEACATKAERQGWDREGARACILTALEEVGDDMSGEALVEWAREFGYEPHDDRAFGPIFASLLRAGLIVRVGECPRRKGNGTRGGSVYRLARAA